MNKFLGLLLASLLAACTGELPEAQIWGGQGGASGQFNEPFDIAVNSKGFVYVSDVRNRRIQKFDAEGNFQLAFGRDVFERPVGIGIGPDDSIWVADFDQDKIFRFDSKGKLLAS